MVAVTHGPSTGWNAYVATLAQTGTGAPTPTVLQNEVGAIVWTRTGVGVYVGTLAGAFVVGKTFVNFCANGVAAVMLGVLAAINTVTLSIFDDAGAAVDLEGTANIEIKVFPS